jgi:hypothetical protein
MQKFTSPFTLVSFCYCCRTALLAICYCCAIAARYYVASEDINHIIISSSNIAQHLYNPHLPSMFENYILIFFQLMCSSWPLLLDGEWQNNL